MLSKSILKYIQSLHHKKFRDEHDLFIAETPKVIEELIKSGKFLCEMICAVDNYYTQNEELLLSLDPKKKRLITPVELRKISLLHAPNKAVGIFYKKNTENIVLKNKLNLLLDEIQDPGNMGTIIRIADWFGIENIICSDGCAEQYNPKVVQASMGSIARVNIVYTSIQKFIKDNNDIKVYAATLQGSPMYIYSNIMEGLLLVGNESKGIKSELLNLVTDQITIPRFGGAESLNVAVATGIILSHLVKDA
jgi:TrmH family RNA methyltransferase